MARRRHAAARFVIAPASLIGGHSPVRPWIARNRPAARPALVEHGLLGMVAGRRCHRPDDVLDPQTRVAAPASRDASSITDLPPCRSGPARGEAPAGAEQ